MGLRCLSMNRLACSLLAFCVLIGCSKPAASVDAPKPVQENVCNTSGIPEVTAIYTAEGVLIWDAAVELPTKNIAYDGIELHGENLCAAKLTYADGIHPAISLNAEIIDGKNLKVSLPWDRPRVDNSILMRTSRSFTRIKMSLLPIDETSRQIWVHAVKADIFK